MKISKLHDYKNIMRYLDSLLMLTVRPFFMGLRGKRSGPEGILSMLQDYHGALGGALSHNPEVKN